MPSHLRNSDLTLNDFRQLLITTRFRTSCRAHLCDSVPLTVHFKMSVYYYYYSGGGNLTGASGQIHCHLRSIISFCSKTQNGSSFVVLAYPGCP